MPVRKKKKKKNKTMPKEYTHWVIAQNILRLPSGPSPSGPVLEAVRSCPYSFLLGSVTPDTPFYYLYGRAKEAFRKIALQTHGEGENDSFMSLKSLLCRYPSDIPLPLLSLFAGTVCHVITDALFHPLVRTLTGTVEGGPRRRIIEKHYLVETCLDVYVRRNSSLPEGGRYKNILAGAEKENPDLIDHLSLYFFREGGHEKKVSQAIRAHSRIQTAFHSPPLAMLITLISPLLPPLQPFRRTFYPQFLNKTYTFFDSVISPPPKRMAGRSLFAALAELARENCNTAFTRINAVLEDRNTVFQDKGPKAKGDYYTTSAEPAGVYPAFVKQHLERNQSPKLPFAAGDLLTFLQRQIP